MPITLLWNLGLGPGIDEAAHELRIKLTDEAFKRSEHFLFGLIFLLEVLRHGRIAVMARESVRSKKILPDHFGDLA